MYWDMNKSLSYNKLFNFIIGQRGVGKTYACKKWCINRFLKTGEQFIYLRRYDTEVKLVGATIVNDIMDEFPDHELKMVRRGKELLVDGLTAGFVMALTKVSDIKSLAMPNIATIVYDEFLIEKGVHHYIRNEPRVFLNFYETIARMRDVRVFFLANSTSLNNPYFSYFKLTLPFGTNIVCKDEILLEMVCNPDFTEVKKKTRFGSIIAGTDYEEYSVENKFVYDKMSFIGKPNSQMRFMYSIKFMGKTYGVWEEMNRAKMWITSKVDPSSTFTVTITNEDHEVDAMMLDNFKGSVMEVLLRYYRFGRLWFDSLEAKGDFIIIAGL